MIASEAHPRGVIVQLALRQLGFECVDGTQRRGSGTLGRSEVAALYGEKQGEPCSPGPLDNVSCRGVGEVSDRSEVEVQRRPLVVQRRARHCFEHLPKRLNVLMKEGV